MQCQLFRIGNTVTIYNTIGNQGTSNSSAMSLTNVPSSLWLLPGAAPQTSVIAGVIDNNSISLGIITVSSGGAYALGQLTVQGSKVVNTAFTASGIKGVNSGFQFTYSRI
jgi:hypothetical protein